MGRSTFDVVLAAFSGGYTQNCTANYIKYNSCCLGLKVTVKQQSITTQVRHTLFLLNNFNIKITAVPSCQCNLMGQKQGEQYFIEVLLEALLSN